jgi:hypothetical protein
MVPSNSKDGGVMADLSLAFSTPCSDIDSGSGMASIEIIGKPRQPTALSRARPGNTVFIESHLDIMLVN